MSSDSSAKRRRTHSPTPTPAQEDALGAVTTLIRAWIVCVEEYGLRETPHTSYSIPGLLVA